MTQEDRKSIADQLSHGSRRTFLQVSRIGFGGDGIAIASEPALAPSTKRKVLHPGAVYSMQRNPLGPCRGCEESRR